MGIFRGGLLGIFTILLFLAILVEGTFITLYFSLDYDAMKPQISSVTSNILEQQGIKEQLVENPAIKSYCESNSEFVFSDPGTNQVFVISCSDILGDAETLIQTQVSKVVEDRYYREYDCGFFDCIQKTQDPFSLVSKHAQDYWKTKLLQFILVCLILAGIVFFLVESKSNFFLLSSILFGIASFIFLKLNTILELALKPFLSVENQIGNITFSSLLDLVSVFISKSSLVFVWFLGIAILLLAVGFVLKFLGAGYEVSNFISKISEKEKLETKEVPKLDKESVKKKQIKKK